MIYLASSWNNPFYAGVLVALRNSGHEVYDFRDPQRAFKWSQIDPAWGEWLPDDYLDHLGHPKVQEAFARDKEALDNCDTLVLLLPCGRSAHLEAGYAVSKGKRVIIYLSVFEFTADLMYLLADEFVTSVHELIDRVQHETIPVESE